MRRTASLCALVLVLDCAVAAAQLRVQTIVAGLSAPVGAVADPAQPGVLYALQQDGLVRTIQGAAVSPAPFLDLRGQISTGGERGLLGMAFAPDTASGRVFVNFTNPNGDTVVARFRRSASNPLVVDPASRFDLRWPNGSRFISQPYANHNGGNLVFGPDGYLYIGLGDGGSGNDPTNNAQNPNALLGKMLRIDVNVPDGDANGYRVPADNPFVGGAPIQALGEIWAFGLRNPWRYSFDNPALGGTGALFIGDVGQDTREEIDVALPGRGGQNYGWRIREGTIATPGVAPTQPAFLPLTDPMLDYDRSAGVTVIGGFVYRGRALGGDYAGRYFFADAGSGRLWSAAWEIDPSTGRGKASAIVDHTAEIGPVGSVVSFAEDGVGELYLVSIGGAIYKLVAQGSPSPPDSLTAQTSGRTVTLAWRGVAGATAYRVEAGSRPGAADLALIDTGSPQTTFVANSVGDGVYYVRVRAVAGVSASPPSNEIVVSVGAAVPCSGAPAQPAGLTAAVANGVVSLTWTAPAGISSIVLEAGYTPGATNAALIVLADSARTYSTMAPAGVYYARVRAANACGTSGASNEVRVVVQ